MNWATLIAALPQLILAAETLAPAGTPGTQKAAAVVQVLSTAVPAAQATIAATPNGTQRVLTEISTLVTLANLLNPIFGKTAATT